jgi:hypothetical protein
VFHQSGNAGSSLRASPLRLRRSVTGVYLFIKESLRFQARSLVLEDKRIGHRARFLYTVLDDMAGSKGEAWPKQETLGRMVGVSRRTIIRWLSELSDYVTILHRPGASMYVLSWRSRKPIEAVTKMSLLQPEAVTPVSHQVGQICHSSSLLVNQEIEPMPVTCEKCEDLGFLPGSGDSCDCVRGREVSRRRQRIRRRA